MIEPLAARCRPGSPPEPIDRQRVDPVLREPKGELLVVRMEAAYVGQVATAGFLLLVAD